MNPNHIAAYGALHQAQTAMQQGQKQAARAFAVQAAQLAPDLEESWLMLAGLAAPRASLAYLSKALEINPQSERAHKGMEWALKRVRSQPAASRPPAAFPRPAARPTALPGRGSPRRAEGPGWLWVGVALLALLSLGLLTGVGALLAGPALAASMSGGSAAWAPAPLQKPTDPLPLQVSPSPQNPLSLQDAPAPAFSPSPFFSPTPLPSDTPQPSPTLLPVTQPAQPSSTPTVTEMTQPSPTLLVLPFDTPVLPTDTPVVLPPSDNPAPTAAGGSFSGERWVEVNLTQQMLYAWDGDTLAASFLVSTGTWQYPTVTGDYRVYARFKYKDMSGPGYYLPDVPNTMFFFEGYALHGTYWHNNFGTPMSHGCVNLSIPDSEWLFNWAPSDLLVNVHY